MTSTAATTASDAALLADIAERAFVQMVAMIHIANHRPDARPGDPKVGGHPAACASSLHILGALHLAAREPQDYVCCKPHAAPMDHAYQHLLGLFRHQSGEWFTEQAAEDVMRTLRKFPEPLSGPGIRGEEVFQSYHARSDADSFHFLPSGTVGIPPVASAYLALAHRYARDHDMRVPPKAHFWSLIGDSEFREGSLLECMPDVSERALGNVTWIIDYNRQNLDGTRIANEKALVSRDCDRIESTARANGWRVVQVRHGAYREELFKSPGGEALRHLFESGLSDYELQHLLYNRKADEVRRVFARNVPSVEPLISALSDAELLRALTDLGGHDMVAMTAALTEARQDPDIPYLVVVHTIKGWGLESFADPSNHSSLPPEKEVRALLEARGLTLERPFERFAGETEQGAYLARRCTEFRAGIEELTRIRVENRSAAKQKVLDAGGLPEALDVDLSLFPMVHTQWMWGQLASKLVRIGSHGAEGHPGMAGDKKPLTPDEERWKTTADLVLTMSPDVGTSTNIAPAMDKRIYGPDHEADEDEIPIDVRHPQLGTTEDAWTRHIRFEIAEANCMSAAHSAGGLGCETRA
jgi:pyruvate dehydrogenase E1 component